MPTILSIIIPCFNGGKYIRRCLDSLLSSISFFPNFEIIVIDDGSTDESRQILKNYEADTQIKIIFLEKNQGPAKARNLGGKQSLGKYLFFLDIDTRLENDCLKTVVEKLEADQSIGALQAKLIMGESQKIETVGHFLSPFGFPYEIGAGESEKEYQEEKPIFGSRTASMAVRKTIFDRIGGFDEDYLIYGEDTDLCWRIWLAGGKIIYFPEAKVYHFGKSSLKEQTRYRVFYEGAKNNTSNILKNASFGLIWWLLPLHVFGWLLVSFKLLLQGRISSSFWVFRGLWWNFKNLSRTWRKRKIVGSYWRKLPLRTIFGPLNLIQLLRKGIRWLIKI